MCSQLILRIEKLRHILQNNFFPRNHLLTYLFSVFIYSSELVLNNEYVIGNKQHRIINKVRNYHDEVEKSCRCFFGTQTQRKLVKRCLQSTNRLIKSSVKGRKDESLNISVLQTSYARLYVEVGTSHFGGDTLLA